ncbi:MAG: metallopeptidase family protein [Pirellulales bacterium]
MNPRLRNLFDEKLEEVLGGMSARVHQMLVEVPLHVEDYPPDDVLRELNVCRGDLCGLFTGVPISERSEFHPPTMPNAVTIFREGIMNAATVEAGGDLNERELKRQIHITVLHELGHHHGLKEDELHELGYG